MYVEAEEGLLEKAGLGGIRQKHAMHEQIIPLKTLFAPKDGRSYAESAFGLNIVDVFQHVYESEQRFVLRDKKDCITVKPQRGNALVECIFGVYPTSADLTYAQNAYVEVYKPERAEASPETWRRVYGEGAKTPLRATRYGLDAQRYWHHDPVLFIFDPTKSTDLIDVWNLRLESSPVLPVPLNWFEALSNDIFEFVKSQHLPVIGNPHGIMHSATIEFSRSIDKATSEALIGKIKPGLPAGALSVKLWRSPIWIDHYDPFVLRNTRLKVTADESSVDLVVNEEAQNSITAFQPLAPKFASRYGGGDHRWVNVLKASSYSDQRVATVLPFNTFDRSWPFLGMRGEQIPIGSEGWVFPQQYKNLAQHVSLLRAEEAIIGSLEQLGVTACLSEPGHIAKQILEHLGGLRKLGILADLDTLKLLNKMAGGLRRRRIGDNAIEESFELRAAPVKDWRDLVAKRKRELFRGPDLKHFTDANVVRLGLETECPTCKATNWSSLTSVDYSLTCQRCLNSYEFPQAELRSQNGNWSYRVVGPFSVPDYGRGSYSALLAMRVVSRALNSFDRLTFATAMNLTFDGISYEVDFIAWHSDDGLRETQRPPQLVIGEAKSLGQGELITANELAKLKAVATKLSETVIVIAVLRDHFTPAESKILRRFVTWGRRVNAYGDPINPVLLLTSHELTMDYNVWHVWKELGGRHAQFANSNQIRTLSALADATQQLYLNMKPFHVERRDYWQKRHARRQADAAGAK
ncbi:hypothetical protein LQG66_04985 [Bradyrhizobium ontarionense]|uniref:Restriction endonuclease n=1 Tax=Bradyrhizobium ontarionense TaxID=2898149 RepID=A0ABY3RF41_9BRAD|nr:hypothetical protein [Bradyrhizobium sp. A19]UFZ05672.1 hypothetical protein LQG66_04985 [Bradyrhizobium sp. A19]